MNVVTQLQEFRQAIYKNLCVLRSYATFELTDALFLLLCYRIAELEWLLC